MLFMACVDGKTTYKRAPNHRDAERGSVHRRFLAFPADAHLICGDTFVVRLSVIGREVATAAGAVRI
jgi:hypothetical protein